MIKNVDVEAAIHPGLDDDIRFVIAEVEANVPASRGVFDILDFVKARFHGVGDGVLQGSNLSFLVGGGQPAQ